MISQIFVNKLLVTLAIFRAHVCKKNYRAQARTRTRKRDEKKAVGRKKGKGSEKKTILKHLKSIIKRR